MRDNKKKRYSIGWHVFVVAVVIALGVWGSDKLSLKDLQPLLGTLQNTSAMVFAISGAWIAYLYPEAISSIVKNNDSRAFSEKLNDDKDYIHRVRLIVGVIVLSGFVMASLLLFSVSTPVIQNSSLFEAYPRIVRGIGLTAIYSITYIQLFAVYTVLVSTVNFLIRLVNIETEIRLDNKLNPLKRGLLKKSSNDDAGSGGA
ncbi:hypothetical protein [Shewanella algae]|uniref:hypothetical protein n=1 Tax=Shewanella algae TaxID=38313 RepID=UPI003C36D5DD